MAVLMTAPASAQVATGSVSAPIVEGLIGPLGLAVSDNGTIYVAESFAGQLTRVLPNGNRSVLFASPGNSVNGVATSVAGSVVIAGGIAGPDPEGPSLDTGLVRVAANGVTKNVASLQDYEVANNPDGASSYGFLDLSANCLAKLPPELQPYTGIVDSNAYAVAALSPVSFAAADAAGNDILRVTNGQVSTVAVLPGVPQRISPAAALHNGLPPCTVGHVYTSEPVPTDVEVGPDGYWYVSSLPGGPELPNTGSVFRINPNNGAVSLVARGLSGAVDLAVAADGTIYVAELDANRISSISNGVVSTVVDLFSPGAIEVATDGTIYATSGVFGPSGSVVIVTP